MMSMEMSRQIVAECDKIGVDSVKLNLWSETVREKEQKSFNPCRQLWQCSVLWDGTVTGCYNGFYGFLAISKIGPTG